MRQILFRGLRIDGKGWVYGFYYEHNFKSYISSEDHSDNADSYYNNEVHPESVGQFTGLFDKSNKQIFEGDRCKVIFYNHSFKNSELTMNVVFVDGGFALIKEGKTTSECIIEDDRTFVPLYYSHQPNSIEIIDNIHDKKEI